MYNMYLSCLCVYIQEELSGWCSKRDENGVFCKNIPPASLLAVYCYVCKGEECGIYQT